MHLSGPGDRSRAGVLSTGHLILNSRLAGSTPTAFGCGLAGRRRGSP
jgi:hypothetical protein